MEYNFTSGGNMSKNRKFFYIFSALLISFSTFSYAEETVSDESNKIIHTAYANSSTPALFEKAKDELFQFNFKDAEELFSLCVKREPKNVDYLCGLAQTKGLIIDDLFRQGKSTLSLLDEGSDIFDLYNKALAIDPKIERARLGEALRLRVTPWLFGGSDDKAEVQLKQIAKDFPNSIFPVHELGILYIKEKHDPKTALDYFLKVEQIVSSRSMTEDEAFWIPRTYHQIGRIYLNNLKQPEKALIYLEKAVLKNCNYVEFGMDLAEAYHQLGKEDQAKEALDKAAVICKQNQHYLFKKDIVKLAREFNLPKDWQKQYNL